jgi:sporulation protein YlmC with PRC-barrel domain
MFIIKFKDKKTNQFFGGIAMKKTIILLIAILAATLFSGQSLADVTKTESSVYTSEQLIGRNVDNLDGEHVGKIRDVNFNADTGEINYVILGKSLLGIGEDTKSAVPLEALKIQNDEESVTVTLIVSEFKLLGAPSMTTNESGEDFRNRLQEYYCASPEFGEGTDGLKQC